MQIVLSRTHSKPWCGSDGQPWKDLPPFQKLHNYLKQSPDWTGGSEGSPRAPGGGQICGRAWGRSRQTRPAFVLQCGRGAVQTVCVPKRPGLALWLTKALSAEPRPRGRALRPGAGGALWGWGSGKGAGVGPGKREMRKEGRARPGWAAPQEMTGRRCRGGEGDRSAHRYPGTSAESSLRQAKGAPGKRAGAVSHCLTLPEEGRSAGPGHRKTSRARRAFSGRRAGEARCHPHCVAGRDARREVRPGRRYEGLTPPGPGNGECSLC